MFAFPIRQAKVNYKRMKYSRIGLSTTQRDVLGWGGGLGADNIVGQLERNLGTEIHIFRPIKLNLGTKYFC